MHVRIQPRELPGFALLILEPAPPVTTGLRLGLRRRQEPECHLGEGGWQRTEGWLAPRRVEQQGNTLLLHLGPEVVDFAAGLTLRLSLMDGEGRRLGQTVVAFPPVQTSGAHDPQRVVTPSPGATPEPTREEAEPGDESRVEEAVEQLLAPPTAASGGESPPAPEPPAATPAPGAGVTRPTRPSPLRILAALLFLLLLAGIGWYRLREPAPTPPPPAPGATAQTPEAGPAIAPPPPTDPEPPADPRQRAARFLEGNPEPAAAYTEAVAWAGRGEGEAALLLMHRAAEGGHQGAALALARLYDPAPPADAPPSPWAPGEHPVAPRAASAAHWYEAAAARGHPLAQRRLGELLMAGGGPLLPPDPQRGLQWLQKAAAQGDDPAIRALATPSAAGR